MSPRANVCATCGLRWKPGHVCPTLSTETKAS
jgi:hypothetical protein